ncbi:hypothetical protein L7F22_050423 [Adiantum nelumboides]|nr:hypothetical protein [Adiantum nelumboides]
MSGITDPYELYKHAHVSEVGVSIGSGMGGQMALGQMFKDRRMNLDVQKDILQETFINTVAGWCNLLLMSSAGPILSTVGACATALQSLDVAKEAILGGKAKFMLVGGSDDYSEEGALEFANMGATISSEQEALAGREPSEMSRPTTTTRGGFMESQGTAVQAVCSARFALEAGLPIQAVIAHSSTHTDKQGRSIPAPGHGVLSSASTLKARLDQWGLDGDSIGVVSMHGTSTKANDKNESHVYHKMFEHLGRTRSNACPTIAQKWLCGHAKGGAAGWALNGLIQSIQSHTVPGNRNADDISPELREFSYLLYASQTIKRPARDLNVGLLTSFGFGQDALALTRNDLVRIKDAPPYPAELEDKVLLNVRARAVEENGTYVFKEPLFEAALPAAPALSKAPEAVKQQEQLQVMMANLPIAGLGIDVEKISTFPSANENFVDKNFTEEEQAYCRSQPDPRASFCGRFCAKEAVFKSMGIKSQGIAASMKSIEIRPDENGAPSVLLDEAASKLVGTGSSKFLVSISHNDDLAVAIVHRV